MGGGGREREEIGGGGRGREEIEGGGRGREEIGGGGRGREAMGERRQLEGVGDRGGQERRAHSERFGGNTMAGSGCVVDKKCIDRQTDRQTQGKHEDTHTHCLLTSSFIGCFGGLNSSW